MAQCGCSDGTPAGLVRVSWSQQERYRDRLRFGKGACSGPCQARANCARCCGRFRCPLGALETADLACSTDTATTDCYTNADDVRTAHSGSSHTNSDNHPQPDPSPANCSPPHGDCFTDRSTPAQLPTARCLHYSTTSQPDTRWRHVHSGHSQHRQFPVLQG